MLVSVQAKALFGAWIERNTLPLQKGISILSHSQQAELSSKTLSKHKSEKAQYFPRQVHLRMQLHISVIQSKHRLLTHKIAWIALSTLLQDHLPAPYSYKNLVIIGLSDHSTQLAAP